jgi:hypothetical protein
MLSDSHHFPKTVAGFCMIAAPLLLLVATVVHPEQKTSEAAQLAVVADNLDAWYAAHLIALVSVALAVPVALGLMHMLREREVAFGHVGGALAMLGLLAFAGVAAMELVVWQMAQSGDQAAMAGLLESVTESAGIALPVYAVALTGFALGFTVLAAGVYRARAAQSWMALFVAVGAILLTLEQLVYTNWLGMVGAAFLLVGLGSIGRMVLSESDADWEHTPEYSGFRPMAGTR